LFGLFRDKSAFVAFIDIIAAPMGALTPGALFGSFEVLSLLGKGGMGEVYRARDRVLKRDVALKVIAPELTNDRETRSRFLREAEVLAALNHPNIGMIFGFQESDGIHCLVLEFIEGETLDARIGRGAMPIPEWTAIVRQIAEGLDAAHSRGVVHRDLKPSNIRITPSGTVKVIDFGLAKLAQSTIVSDTAETAAEATKTGVIMGTLSYMSPEQLFGKTLDSRSDTFSLGVVLYEMATMQHPFHGSTQVEVMNKIINASQRGISDIRPDFPPELQRIVDKCLRKDPGERFGSVKELLELLKDPSSAAQLRLGKASPNNLPRLLTRFVGRQRETLEIERILRTASLITLAGPGGAGKTRLALAVGQAVLETHPEGVWFVDLAPISKPDLVLRTVAAALGVREESRRSLDELLGEYFTDKRLLLILDNCEHVLSACADLVGPLLRRHPELRVLTTTREPLHVAGEVVFRVPCLTLVDAANATPAEAMRNEAVELFVDRAKAVTPSFELNADNVHSIVSICGAVEGIPLAIELAAARARLMSPAQILERLSDRLRLLGGSARASVERQQTLRATLDWSYGLLSDEEKTLFNQLAAFRGGWTLEAAEAVCKPTDSGGMEVLDLLSALADKSLVTIEHQRSGQPRFRYLETIRDYARERLNSGGDAQPVLGNHAAFFADLAEENRFLRQRKEGFDRAHADHDNFRSALEWSATHDPRTGLRLAVALWGFWQAFSYLSEARSWLERMLAVTQGMDLPALRIAALNDATEASTSQCDYAAASDFSGSARSLARSFGDQPLLAVALSVSGRLAYFQEQYDLAESYFEEALSIRRLTADRPGEGIALSWLGEIKRGQNDFTAAIALLEQSLEIHRSINDERGAASTLNRLGIIFGRQGRYPQDISCFEEAMGLFRKVGDKRAVAGVLGNIAEAAMRHNDLESARRTMHEVLELQKELGLRRDYAESAARLGMIAQYLGDSSSARTLLTESLTIARDMRSKVIAADSLAYLGRAALSEGDLASARSHLAEGLRTFSELKNVEGIAFSLEGLAALASREGHNEKSIRLWAAADRIRKSTDSPLAPVDQEGCESALSSLRSSVGDDLFSQNWQRGSELTDQQAVDYALE
jgi:non-specific serine/threonine protein kinase